ncbi:Stf0 family sulfotransferase [Sphingomonas sp. RT2P30]|uniref:Stf0 family sulfotransferase n=1 Tax=Parasphingomonas halimpatiens TaxID=3096162 RepID=UPI002FCC23B1
MTSDVATFEGRKLYDLATAQHDYPAWDGAPRKTVLICTHQRSGSTLLGEAIHFADGLGCPLEYFHGGFRPSLADRWGTPDLESYTRAVTRFRTDPSGTLSVKIFWRDMVELANELDPIGFPDLADRSPADTDPETYRGLAALLAPIFPAPTYVHLARRDRLRQAISAVAASESGLWRSIPNVGEQEPRAEPQFDLDRIERLIGYSDYCHGHWDNFFAALGVAPHRVTYEQLAADYQLTVANVLLYLGSDAPPPPVRMRRQATDRNEAVVMRYLRERAARAATVHATES